jgi:hypothetical protein
MSRFASIAAPLALCARFALAAVAATQALVLAIGATAAQATPVVLVIHYMALRP